MTVSSFDAYSELSVKAAPNSTASGMENETAFGIYKSEMRAIRPKDAPSSKYCHKLASKSTSSKTKQKNDKAPANTGINLFIT